MTWSKFYNFEEILISNPYVNPHGKIKNWSTNLEGKHGRLAKAHGCTLNPEGKLDNDACGLYMIRIKGAGTKSGFYDYIGMATDYKAAALIQRGIFGRLTDHYRKIICLPHRGDIAKSIQKAHPDKQDIHIHDDDVNKSNAEKFFCGQIFNDYEHLRNFFKNPEYERDKTEPEFTFKMEKNFKEMFNNIRNDLRTHDSIKSYLKENVQIAFNSIPDPEKKKYKEKVAKGEGLAIQAYIHKYEEKPFLNDKNELTTMEGFKENILKAQN